MTRRSEIAILGAALWWVAQDASCAPTAAAEERRGAMRAQAPASGSARLCAGPHGSSRVTLSRAGEGGQTLRSETDLPWRAGSTRRLHLTETASLDARGRLLSARIIAVAPSAPVTSYILEPSAGLVRILRDGAATVSWRVPADAPWVYRALSSAGGLLAASPVAGWVAARAAGAAPVVRVLVPERQQSYLVPIDQVAVVTEKGVTVVLDGDGVDTDSDLVTELRLADRSLTLECADLALVAGHG